VTADDRTATMLSVRGEAQLSVPPDDVVLSCRLSAVRATKPEALHEAAGTLQSVVEDLRRLGGQPLTAASRREDLTWSARSATTWTRHDHDHDVGDVPHPPEQVVAEVSLDIVARDLGRLDSVERALSRHDAAHVSAVQWRVDVDNPAWKEVRTAAITVAMNKARDYAAALGGQLAAVEHVADVGLLNGGQGADSAMGWVAQAGYAVRGGNDAQTPALDPVPQDVAAVIEARFSAIVPALAEG
jgi:uncharacterized protein